MLSLFEKLQHALIMILAREWKKTEQILDFRLLHHFSKIEMFNLTKYVRYINRSGDSLLPPTEVVQPVARLEDGHWTKPYFDCGGGNIWMVTYSSPIFGLEQDKKSVMFR